MFRRRRFRFGRRRFCVKRLEIKRVSRHRERADHGEELSDAIRPLVIKRMDRVIPVAECVIDETRNHIAGPDLNKRPRAGRVHCLNLIPEQNR